MTNLEERFFNEFNNPTAYSLKGFELEQHYAQIAAKIALEIAERAYDTGWDSGYGTPLGEGQGITFEDFMQRL